MYKEFGISENVINVAKEVEKELEPIFEKYEENCLKASVKVLKAFQDNRVATTDFILGGGYAERCKGRME